MALNPIECAEARREVQTGRGTGLRICQLVTYDIAPNGGGVKQHAVHLAAALRELGDEVTVLGPSSAPIDEPGVVGLGGVVNVPGNGSDNYLGIFVNPLLIHRFFRENRFDVIHVHEPLNPSLSYWTTWMTGKVPHVATFHAYAEQESRTKRLARQFWGHTLFPFFQRAIAVSSPAEHYAKMAWRGPMTVIPNGVPTRLFHPGRTRPEGRKGPLKLLFVGRLGDARKGARFMIEAFARVQAKGLPVTLDMIGELGDFPAPPKIPGLTYHGSVPMAELAARYRACDVFVAPSTGQESFGIILLEAMASAKPVICSDIEGYRRVVCREGARLVPPSDSWALQQAIEELVSFAPAVRRRMGELNLAHARQFDWDAVARKVRREYLAAMRLPAEDPRAAITPLEDEPEAIRALAAQ